MIGVPRIAPLEAPFEPEVEEQLRSMMPAGVPPIGLFRTFVRNLPMAAAMQPWGRHELSRSLSVGLREQGDRDRPDVRPVRLRVRVGRPRGVLRGAGRARRRAQVTSLTHGRPEDAAGRPSGTGC